MDIDVNEEWIKDLHEFIDHWEQELVIIKNQQLGEEVCNNIAEIFQKDKNILLCRRPAEASDKLISKLDPLSSKLDASLAQALSTMKIERP